MKRKLVKQGRNALTVTLPSEWTAKRGLKAGDEVDVQEKGKNIFISGRGELEENKIEIDVSGLDPMIKRVLSALYKAGYDEIKVNFNNSSEFEAAQEVIREEFVGFDITHHSKNNITIRSIASIESKEFDVMMRRLFLIIKSMGEDCIEASKKNDLDFIKVIIMRDKDVNKIADFCRRALNKGGKDIEGRIPPLYFIIEQLEKIGDMYRDVCKVMLKSKIKLTKESIDYFMEVNSFFDEYYKLYFGFDLKKMSDFGKKRAILADKSEKMMSSAKKEELNIVFYLKGVIEANFDMNGALMAARL